jgi:hypothetical protein
VINFSRPNGYIVVTVQMATWKLSNLATLSLKFRQRR